MTGEPRRHVTERGCTLTVIPASEHLGDGVLLHMRMEQEGDGRFAEVYLNPADMQWLAGELGLASLSEYKARVRDLLSSVCDCTEEPHERGSQKCAYPPEPFRERHHLTREEE